MTAAPEMRLIWHTVSLADLVRLLGEPAAIEVWEFAPERGPDEWVEVRWDGSQVACYVSRREGEALARFKPPGLIPFGVPTSPSPT
jgi:hypothetical protein